MPTTKRASIGIIKSLFKNESISICNLLVFR